MNVYRVTLCDGHSFNIIAETFNLAYRKVDSCLNDRLGTERVSSIENLGSLGYQEDEQEAEK